MDPTTLSSAAIATLVVTKALEKTGETLGEKALDQGGKLIQLLKNRFPDIANKIERVEPPSLDSGGVYLDETIAREIEAAAKKDNRVAEEVQILAQTVTNQIMASGIKVTGNLKTGKMIQIQKGKPGVRTNQTMLTNVEAVNIEVGDLSQEG